MAPKTTDRLRRILALVPWVIANEGATVEEVCERFRITGEELAGDLQLLFMCGLPPFAPDTMIEAFVEDDRVVIRMPHQLDRPPRLTRSEALSLLVMGRAVASLPGIEEGAALRSALDKLADAMAPDDAAALEEVLESIAVSLGSTGAELLAELRAAVDERARLRIEHYSAARGEMIRREVDPAAVIGRMGAWYLAALDHRSGEMRTFRVDRIRSVERTGERADPPAIDPATVADAPAYTPSEDDLDVVIELGPEAAWLREVIAIDRERPLDDGWTRLELRTAHLAWLVRYILAAGPQARPVSPSALREAVADAARRTLARYA